MAYYFIRETTYLDDLTDVILAMLNLEHMLIYDTIDFKTAIHMYNKNDQFTKRNIQPQTINVIDRIIIKWSDKFSTSLITYLRKVIFPRTASPIRKQMDTHANIVCHHLHQKIDLDMVKDYRLTHRYVSALIRFYIIHDVDKALKIIRGQATYGILLKLFQHYPTKDMARKIVDIAKDMRKCKIGQFMRNILINMLSLYLTPDDLKPIINE
jgi:hypothetical protein